MSHNDDLYKKKIEKMFTAKDRLVEHVKLTAKIVSDNDLDRLRITEELLIMALKSKRFNQVVKNQLVGEITKINRKQLEVLGYHNKDKPVRETMRIIIDGEKEVKSGS